ncbi:MAG: arginyltransferase [Methyloprofundus sp.]|nr:arginyltransferase [Methyloprofundus sp.]
MISIPLYVDKPHACSYLDEHQSRFSYIHPSVPLETALYSQLLERGFRRSGAYVYQTSCHNCQKCVAVRLAVNDFQASRQQRRVWKKNGDIEVIVKPAVFEQAHYDLYVEYQKDRHEGGNMAEATEDDYISFLSSAWSDTLFVEFSCAGELAGVAVIDRLEDALSAVYTFFDPKFAQRSLGVYAVLWGVEYAKSLGLKWNYLGYWIADCQKMSYKTKYQPLQGFVDEQWCQYDAEQGFVL